MQVLVDTASHILGSPSIVQVDRVPVKSTGIPINGKYLLPTLPGLDFYVDSSSYVLPIDGNDITSQSYAHLLASYSMFGNIYYNPLLTAANLSEIDFAATYKDAEGIYAPPASPHYFPSRFQSGRPAGGGFVAGQMPTHTAILPANIQVTPPNPGVMVSTDIDISAYTAFVGADEFMLYYQLYSFSTSPDWASNYALGVSADKNEPAIRTYLSADQEPSGFSAYISPDDGDHWCPANLMEPIAFWNKTTHFRVAFVNRGSVKLYLASFAVLF